MTVHRADACSLSLYFLLEEASIIFKYKYKTDSNQTEIVLFVATPVPWHVLLMRMTEGPEPERPSPPGSQQGSTSAPEDSRAHQEPLLASDPAHSLARH